MTYDRWRATHRRVSNLDPTFALLYRKETGNILGEEGGGAPTAIHLFDHGFILENPVHGGGEILVVHVGASEDVFAAVLFQNNGFDTREMQQLRQEET